ncbi:hypothetical protein U1Q18_047568 [Sarracenia purpurea var. burkii]
MPEEGRRRRKAFATSVGHHRPRSFTDLPSNALALGLSLVRCPWLSPPSSVTAPIYSPCCAVSNSGGQVSELRELNHSSVTAKEENRHLNSEGNERAEPRRQPDPGLATRSNILSTPTTNRSVEPSQSNQTWQPALTLGSATTAGMISRDE